MIASTSVLTALAGLVAIEAIAIANRLDASPLDPAFCSPSSLHTTTEPPETQLTRDYAAIRILLKDPADHFSQIRRVYGGELHVSPAARAQPSVLKRAERAKLLKAEYQRTPWSGSLRQEVQRIDRERGTTLALTIDRGLQARDHVKVETTFREVFAILLDDLLISIQRRLTQSVSVGRALQHARRFYGEGLDAYLSINTPEQAARASFALDAMARAIEELKAGKSSARDWFARERGNFMRAINEGLGARIGRQAISAPAPTNECPAPDASCLLLRFVSDPS
jgi:hypothetical protein